MRQQLTTQLQGIQSSINRGIITSAKGQLNTFINTVRSQSGYGVKAAYASLLMSWAQDLLARL